MLLLLGDPGCGKSTILRAVEELAPRSVYASEKGATEAGMTAAVTFDDFGDSPASLEAGALVVAHKGIACVDELDKIPENVVSGLHDALERPAGEHQ
jgi:replicative DNA helicase Mcm